MRIKSLYQKTAALAAWVLPAAAALAGDDGYVAPDIERTPPWLAIMCALLFVAAAAFVAFKHSRRTHLD